MIKKTIITLLLIVAVVLIAIQFYRPSFNNPPVVEGERIQDIHRVPPEVLEILTRSCADCHSNKTRYPWYSGVAPLSWGMHDHIRVGREELNFSIWGRYSEQRRRRKLKEMCREIESGEMPFYQYLWLHREAVLTEEHKKSICQWTENARRNDFGQTGDDEESQNGE